MYIFQYHPINPQHVFSKTLNSIFYWNMSHLYAGPGNRVTFTMDRWLPPPPGWIKLNFDGAFSGSTCNASNGGLAKDPYGDLIMAYNCQVQVAYPLEAELLALERSLLHLVRFASNPIADRRRLSGSDYKHQEFQPPELEYDATLEEDNTRAH